MPHSASIDALRGAIPIGPKIRQPVRVFGGRGISGARTGQPTFLSGRVFSALAIFAALLASTTPSPLYPVYIREWSLPQSAGTTIFSVYALGTLVSLFLAGWLEDKTTDRRQVLLPALLLTMIGALLFAQADNVWTLMLGRLISGVSTGLITGTASAAILDLETPHKRGRAATVATVAFTGGAASGPVLASIALGLDVAPLVAPFQVIAAVAAIAFVGLSLSPWRKTTGVEPTRAHGRSRTMSALTDSLLQSRLFWVSCFGITVSWMVGSMLMALGVTLVTDLFGLHIHALAGLTPAVFQLFAGAGQLIGSRFWSLHAIILGLVGLALMQVVTVLGAVLGWAPLFLIAMPLMGLFYGFAFVGGAALVNESAPQGKNTRRISNFYVVGYLANALPTFALGFLIDALDLSRAFYLFSAGMVAVAGLGIATALRRRKDILAAI